VIEAYLGGEEEDEEGGAVIISPGDEAVWEGFDA
jgi:hypothetical protein